MCDKAPEDDRPRPYPGTSRPRQDRDQGEAMMPMPSRERAASVLRRTADELRRKADGLERLAVIADSLMPGDPADETLWDLALKARRPF